MSGHEVNNPVHDSFETEDGGSRGGKNSKKLKSVIRQVSEDGSLAVEEKRRIQSQKLSALFDKHSNGNGIIDVNGFTKMMTELGVNQTPKDAVETFRTIDEDDNGEIDIDEFAEFYWATHSYENTPSMRFLVAVQAQLAQGADDGMFQSSDHVFHTLAMSTEADIGEYTHGFFAKLVIMPDSSMRTRWDLFMITIIMFSAAYEPYSAVFFKPQARQWWEVVLDLLYWVDIFMNFVTAFKKGGYELVYQPQAIAKHYMKTWFCLDLVAAVQWTSLVIDLGLDWSITALQLLRLIRILRCIRVGRIFQRVSVPWGIQSGWVGAVKFFGYVAVVAHVFACLFYVWPSIFDTSCADNYDKATLAEPLCTPVSSWREHYGLATDSRWEQYITSLYWSVTTMTTIGYGDVTPQA